MFEVGDKVRYVPNADSPRNASTDAEYIQRENAEGVIRHAHVWLTYGYEVEFGSGARLPFAEAELELA